MKFYEKHKTSCHIILVMTLLLHLLRDLFYYLFGHILLVNLNLMYFG